MGLIDAELARMLADLGGSRRDDISAPAADNKGNAIRIDMNEEAAALARDNQRREQIKAQAQNNEDCARLDAWNIQDNFESVGPQESLANFTNGQSHRSSLQFALGPRDQKREARERRYGVERLLYLEQRGSGSATTHNTDLRAPRAREGRKTVTSNGISRAEPSSFLSARQPRPQFGRALSPRAAGTVRFVRDRRTSKADSPTHTSKPSGDKASPNSKMDLLTDEPMLFPIRRSTSPLVPFDSTSAKTNGHPEAINRTPTSSREPSKHQQPAHISAAKARIARAQLVDEAIHRSTRQDSPEVVLYYQAHPERKWIMTEVLHMRRLLRKSIRDFRDYIDEHSEIEDIAEAVEQAAAEDENALPVDLVEPSSTQTNKSATLTPINKTKSVNGTTPIKNGKQYAGLLELRVLDTKARVVVSRPLQIKPPVNVNIDLVAQSAAYNPMHMVRQIERMMQKLSLDDNNIEGAEYQADGLWVEV